MRLPYMMMTPEWAGKGQTIVFIVSYLILTIVYVVAYTSYDASPPKSKKPEGA